MEKKEKEVTNGCHGNGHAQEDGYTWEEKEREEIYCGIGPCRPGFMQKCANIKCVTAALCFSGLASSTLSIYINSQITTLERQFGFSSQVSGILLSCNDFGYLLTTLAMSFLARRVHIPRALGISTFLFGISGLICSIPFFATRDDLPAISELTTDRITNVSFNSSSPTTRSSSPGLAGIFGKSLCSPSSFSSSSAMAGGLTGGNSSNLGGSEGYNGSCDDEGGEMYESSAISANGKWMAVTCIGVGMVFQGFGKSPRHPFTGTYIDDNVPKTKTTLYLGILTGISMFGPLLAFVMGGVFSRLYLTLEDVDMSPTDPRWVGAWWLGFLLFGFMGVLAALPPCFFPRRLKPQPHLRKMEQDRKLNSKGRSLLLVDLKDFFKSILRLLQTPVYLCLVLGSCISLMGISGTLSFMPKYLETQFMIPAWKANIILGALNIVSASAGTMLGGVVTSRFKLSPLKCLKLMVTVSCCCLVFNVAGFFLGCDQPHLSKGPSPQASVADGNFTGSSCLANCQCDGARFFPTCGSDGVTYYSPCHAGCTANQGLSYSSCSCVNETLAAEGGVGSRGGDSVSATAVPGFCATDCHMLYPYAIMNFFGGLFATFVIMPSFVVSIRSVLEKDKPLAIGFSAFLSTLIGWFLGPIVYGKVIDTCCLLWSSGCHGSGSCNLYNIEAFRFRYHALAFMTRFGCTLFYILALVIAIKKHIKFSSQEGVSVSIDDDLDDEEKKDQKPENEKLMLESVLTGNGNKSEVASEERTAFIGGKNSYKD